MRATPQLKSVEQVSDGWIKKYIMTYTLPDGSEFQYESASRKGIDAYEAELARYRRKSDAVVSAIDNGADDFGAAAAAADEAASPEPRTADAVSIVPISREGELVLIREFRYPLNSWVIGLPAGLVEPGEPLDEAVDRELREETGYALRRDLAPEAALKLLPQAGHSSTGMSDESVQTVFAQVEKVGEATPEPNEFIEVFTLAIADVPRFLQQNKLPLGTRLQLVLEKFAG
jgi:ADP-ribose pyrophosphatase